MSTINRKRGAPVLASRRPGSTESWFGKQADGSMHLNAGSNVEVMQNFARLMSEVSSGKVQFADPDAFDSVNATTAAEEIAAFRESYRDRQSSAWAETGADIGGILYETAVRMGFARRFLSKVDLAQGAIPRIQVRYQNVSAIVASDPGQWSTAFAKQRYLYPPEIYIIGNVRVEERDIAQGAPDLLEDVFMRSQEQFNVQEDRQVTQGFDKAVGAANPLYLMGGGATPSNLAAASTQLRTWGLPVTDVLLSADFWSDIAGNANSFGNLFDPVTQYELNQTGVLGNLLGMRVTTDGFRDPNQHVVAANEGYILTDPINLGAYTDRGPVNATPVDNYPDGVPARGWSFFELVSMSIVNPRGVVKVRRV